MRLPYPNGAKWLRETLAQKRVLRMPAKYRGVRRGKDLSRLPMRVSRSIESWLVVLLAYSLLFRFQWVVRRASGPILDKAS